jgi:hypothetical protein
MRVLKERLSHPGTSDVTTLLIPGYKQTQAFTCGFVAGLMVLHALYPKASAEAFYRRVRPDPKMGTSNKKLIQALRQSGVSLSVVSSGLGFPEIQRNIDAGFPILTILKTNSDNEAHWVVIYGYGIKRGKPPTESLSQETVSPFSTNRRSRGPSFARCNPAWDSAWSAGAGNKNRPPTPGTRFKKCPPNSAKNEHHQEQARHTCHHRRSRRTCIHTLDQAWPKDRPPRK